MKQIKITFVLTVLMSMVGLQAFADFDTSTKVQVGDLYYYLDNANNQAMVTSCASKYSGDITIPSSITYDEKNYSVTSIGEDAFYYCYGLTSVTIPNSVTSIGEYAFQGCYGLTSVTIPNSVTYIGNNAFDECGLTSVTLNSNDIVSTYRMERIFDNQVKEYIIGEEVTSIGEAAFCWCSGLTSVTIPNSVTSIGGGAFASCHSLTSIIIPNSVTSIGWGAFNECSDLTSVTIGNSVTSIGNNAFDYCTGLKKVIVSDIAAWCGISFGNNRSNPLYYAHHIYSDENTEIKDLVIPNSVTSIGVGAFAGCSGLTSVTIPNSVTSIGDYAFSDCAGLTSVTIPNSVTSIGEGTFLNCSSLTSVTVPNSVTSIGEWAFEGCSSLTAVNISDIEKWSQISFGNRSANPLWHAGHLYMNDEEVTKLILANDISNYAFAGCEGLTEVDVKGVGTDAFAECPNITAVKVDCETVENWFADSKAKVQTLTLGENVTTINANSFDGFSALKKVYLGRNVSAIGAKAFANCGMLDDVYCYAVNYPNVERNTFENSYLDYVTLHVPAESVNQYKNHETWGRFMAVVPIEDEETNIERVTMTNGTGSAPVIYNLNGQRINSPAKGLNIINGRKVVIK